MIIATVSGRVTKDAQIRQAGSANLCSFGIASNAKRKGEDVTTFVDVSIFGKRGETLCQYLTKGAFVIVSGEMSTREHNGKTYISVDAQSVELGPKGGGQSGGGGGQRQQQKPAPAADEYGGADDSDIPF